MKRVTEIAKVFDDFSTDYTSKMVRYVPFYLKMLESLVSYLPEDFKPASILELGSGNGNVTSLLLHHFPGASYHLVDASKQMLDLCKERFSQHQNITYEQALFQDLHLPDNSFDLVVAGISLHHLDGSEKRSIFPRIHSWLKSSGIFGCCDLMINKNDNPYHSTILKEWEAYMKEHGAGQEDWEWLMDHYDTYDRPDAFSDQQKWLIDLGFANVKLSWNDGPWTCFHAHI